MKINITYLPGGEREVTLIKSFIDGLCGIRAIQYIPSESMQSLILVTQENVEGKGENG